MTKLNPLNVPGRFANSIDCIRCELCVNHAPQVFSLDADGKAYTYEQPKSEEQTELALEAVENCPIRGIKDKENSND